MSLGLNNGCKIRLEKNLNCHALISFTHCCLTVVLFCCAAIFGRVDSDSTSCKVLLDGPA